MAAGGLIVAAPQPAGAMSLSAATLPAPVVFPADGATLTDATPTVTATYDAPYATDGTATLSVTDTTTGTSLTCTDVLRQVSGDEELRCPLPPLTNGDTYTATAHEVDVATGDQQTTTWSFAASVPTVTSQTPTDYVSGAPFATFDRALGASTTVELFAESGTARTRVPGTPSVATDTATFTPTDPLADGEYALVIHAIAADDATSFSDMTDEFFVGTPPASPAQAPVVTAAVTGSLSQVPGTFTVRGTAAPGAQVQVQVYDPADPTGPQHFQAATVDVPACSTSTCAWRVQILIRDLAVIDTPYSWRVFNDVGSVASSPDRLVTPIDVVPAAPTQVSAPSLVNAANVTNVPISVTLPAGDVGAFLDISAPFSPDLLENVAAVDGEVNLTVNISDFEDGELDIYVLAYDGFGNVSTDLLVSSTLNAVLLSPTWFPSDTEVSAQPDFEVTFNEPISTLSTLSITTAGGRVVPGRFSVAPFGGNTMYFNGFGSSSHLKNGATVRLSIHVYAWTCQSSNLPTCNDQYTRTWTEVVDTVPPAAPTAVTCSPAVISPSSGIATVTGLSTPGDRVYVTALPIKGGEEIQKLIGPLGPADVGSKTSWSTTLDLSGGPNEMYQFVGDDLDPAGNLGPEAPRVECGKGSAAVLTLASSPADVSLGQTVTVHGRLTSAADGTPLAGRVVHVKLYLDRAKDSWFPQGTTTTDSDGRWSKTVTPQQGGYFNAATAGGGTYLPSSSWASGLPPRTVVRTPLHITSPQPDSSSNAATELRVRGTTGSYFEEEIVHLTLTSSSGTRVLHAKATIGSSGRWSVAVAVPRGRWTLKAAVAGTANGGFPGNSVTEQIRRT
jgi:hypothetical protein